MSQYSYKCDTYKSNFRYINTKVREAFVSVEEKKSIGSVLFLIFTIFITPFIYLISPFIFLFDLLSNEEYSKGYLEYQIEQEDLDPNQALLFLEAKYLKYQKAKIENRLVFSETKHNQVEENFSYLTRKFNNLVPASNNEDKITLETDSKGDIKEQESGDLQSNLTDKQKDILIKCINELRIFKSSINRESFEKALTSNLEKPITINRNKNKLLAYLFSELSYKNLISFEWQSICANNSLFMSYGGIILTQNNYSSTVYDVKENPPKDSHIIDNYLKQLKEH